MTFGRREFDTEMLAFGLHQLQAVKLNASLLLANVSLKNSQLKRYGFNGASDGFESGVAGSEILMVNDSIVRDDDVTMVKDNVSNDSD